MQMNYTVCLINAEYVEYGTFDNYADELYNAELENMIHLISMQMNFTVCVMNAEYVEYGTFDKYADELYNIFNDCRVCRIWYIISIQMNY